jgi:hypothetical protein
MLEISKKDLLALTKHLSPEIENIATDYMPEVVSDLSYDF